MAKNVEIKARIPSLEFPKLKERVSGLADGESVVLNQVDSFFVSKKGRLKLREFSDEIQTLTDSYVGKVDESLKNKEQEIMQV